MHFEQGGEFPGLLVSVPSKQRLIPDWQTKYITGIPSSLNDQLVNNEKPAFKLSCSKRVEALKNTTGWIL